MSGAMLRDEHNWRQRSNRDVNKPTETQGVRKFRCQRLLPGRATRNEIQNHVFTSGYTTTTKTAPKYDETIPDELSKNPIKHPGTKEPPIPMPIISNQLPPSSFGINSLPATPTIKPMIVPHIALDKGTPRSACAIPEDWLNVIDRFRKKCAATRTRQYIRRLNGEVISDW